MKKLMLSVLALVAVVLSANAQSTTSAAVTGHVELLAPLTVAQGTNSLEFGKIAIGTAGGTVAMIPTNTGTFTAAPTGGVALALGTTRTVADFDVTGQGALTYHIATPANLTLTGTTSGVIVAFSTPDASRSLVSGADKFYVGGTLTIPASSVAGQYTGTFNVTVNYN